MSLAKRQHEERESVSSLFFMRQKKKFESELNFAATNSPIQLLPLRVHFGLPWSLHLHYLNFRHIVYVYTSSIRRIFYVFFSLSLSLSLPFSRIFFLFYMGYSWNFFQNFFRSIQYICSIFLEIFFGIFLEFFSIYTIYVMVFLEFFSVSPIKLPKIFLLIQYICSSFLEFFPIYVVYMQYICSSFSFCLTSY